MPSAAKQIRDFDGEVLVNFEPQQTILGHGKDAFPSQLGGVSVLIVDDDATVLDATRQQLERWGCRVRAAPSAVEACDPAGLSAATPDVIVADYQLAGGATGIEAISAIRIMLGRSVPALLVTGCTSPEALSAARAGGFPLLRKRGLLLLSKPIRRPRRCPASPRRRISGHPSRRTRPPRRFRSPRT
jgi:CheY-like chemotaxis protein